MDIIYLTLVKELFLDNQKEIIIISSYKPIIFIIILYRIIRNNKINRIKNIRSFGTLNKFLKGVKIIKIKPAKLLIKKRG